MTSRNDFKTIAQLWPKFEVLLTAMMTISPLLRKQEITGGVGSAIVPQKARSSL